jgi:predicted RNase H-like HicB family nuclease
MSLSLSSVMDYMRTEYRFDYQKARPNRFVGRTKHRIVIEKANDNLSAYSPDLPGCVATGKTREQIVRNMREAIEMHVQGLMEDNNEKDGGVK